VKGYSGFDINEDAWEKIVKVNNEQFYAEKEQEKQRKIN
jgi:hypothetical protein